MGKPLVVSLVAVAALALGMGVASADTKHYKSKVKIHDLGIIKRAVDISHGKVKSRQDACLDQRKVKMFLEQPGKDDRLGASTTHADGSWSIPIPLPVDGNTYYAKVRKLKLSPGKVCDGARSKDFEYTAT